jgi:GT2 family glycosyltransferase
VTDSVAIRLREHARWFPPQPAEPEHLPNVTVGMAGNPLTHFLETGADAGWRPNPLFDPVYYLTENPDVAAAGLNPLAHFLERGAQEGRRPNPLFDPTYYLKANPDVAAAGVNPLAHFLDVGAAQGRKPNPLFDTAYYLQQNPDVAAAGINPLAHYLERGAQEGRRPNPLFDTAYYLDQNPDVVESGMNPLVHFLEFGAQEGRRPSPAFDTAAYLHRNPEVSRAGINLVPLSVVIPTHNRGALLAQTLEACHRNAGGCELEIIVIDDGSTDDTAERLAALSATIPNLHWHSARKVGPARARNIGADAARHDVIVFLGDDIQPLNGDFFRIHASLHARHPAANLAVLGKVEWPQWGAGRITPTMLHVQGRGGEQFGYSHLTPYQLAGWQYFYTANVSVKKALVRDWIREGFDTGFSTAAYEDLEFAYRQSRPPQGLRIFYDPAALAAHHHHYTLAQFMDRQFSAGKGLIHLLELHPELAATCNFQEFVEALRASRDFPAERLPADSQLAIEGVKAWARQLDEEGELGRQPWHEDFLSAVLELCLLDGFLSAWPHQDANLAAARALLLDRFCQRLRPSLPPELADWSFLAKAALLRSAGTPSRPSSR